MARISTFHLPSGSSGTALISTSGVTSPGATISGKMISITTQLTSTGDWAAKAGTGQWSWGLEYSSNGGTSWRWAVHAPGDGADPESLLIGATDRSGGMPMLGIGGGNFKDLVGSRLRLRAATAPRSSNAGGHPTVRVGADITVVST